MACIGCNLVLRLCCYYLFQFIVSNYAELYQKFYVHIYRLLVPLLFSYHLREIKSCLC